MTPSGYVLGAITTILVYAAGWLFVNYTPVGGDDNHVISIGVGGGMGIVMLFNVWGIIWPNNKKIIRGTLAGTPPAERCSIGAPGVPGFADKFLSVRAAPVLHGGEFALLQHGDFREIGVGRCLRTSCAGQRKTGRLNPGPSFSCRRVTMTYRTAPPKSPV